MPLHSTDITNGGAAKFRCGFAVGKILSVCRGWWFLGEGDAGDLLKIVDKRQVVPRLEQRRDGVLLVVAEFEGEETVWLEGVVGLGDEAAVDVEAGFAGEERGGGLVDADLGVEGGAVG